MIGDRCANDATTDDDSLGMGGMGDDMRVVLGIGYFCGFYNLCLPLIRPSGTFSRRGRRRHEPRPRVLGLLPLREKVGEAG